MSEVHESLASIPTVRAQLLQQLKDGNQLESCFVLAHLVCEYVPPACFALLL